MFVKLRTKLNIGVNASITALCLCAYLSFVPYTILMMHHDWQDKTDSLTAQVIANMSIKLDGIESAYQTFSLQHMEQVLSGKLSANDGNRVLRDIRLINMNISGTAVVLKDKVYSSELYYGTTALIHNFGVDAYDALQQITQPTCMINRNVISSNMGACIFRIIPIETVNGDMAFFLMFFDMLAMLRDFKLEDNIFLRNSCAAIETGAGEYFQLLTRLGEPIVNWERRLPSLPEVQSGEYAISRSIKNYGFKIHFYVSQKTLLNQCALVILIPLIFCLCIVAFGFYATSRFTHSIEIRLEELLQSMNDYKKSAERKELKSVESINSGR